MSDSKACTKCGAIQLLTNFPPRKNRKDGRCSHCRECNRAKTKKWIADNYEYALQASRGWHHANRDKANAGRIERYHAAMKDPAYREKHSASSSQWRKRNPELANQYSREWTRNNPEKNSARAGRYRASRIKATPTWADMREILALYEQSDLLSASTGVRHHVDHIVPLQGKTVCGLHVHWNLRVIPAVENIKKGAKLIEEVVNA